MTAIAPEKIERIEEMAAASIEKTRLAVNKKLDKASRKIAAAADELRETELVGSEPRRPLRRAKGVLAEKKRLVADKASQVSEKVRQVSEKAQNGYGQLRDGVADAGKKTRHFARKNPVTSAAIAMGVGLATGLAIRQARD